MLQIYEEKCQKLMVAQQEGNLRFQGPCKMANPSMNKQLPRVKASANFRGLMATADC